jgi:hypothetical protein
VTWARRLAGDRRRRARDLQLRESTTAEDPRCHDACAVDVGRDLMLKAPGLDSYDRRLQCVSLINALEAHQLTAAALDAHLVDTGRALRGAEPRHPQSPVPACIAWLTRSSH